VTHNNIDDLLTPTLSPGAGQAPSIYSLTASVLTAFFGGPFAVIALTAVNSWRLDQVRRDIPILSLLATATIGVLFLLVRADHVPLMPFVELPDDRALLIKAWALAIFGMCALLHQRFQRNMSFSATPRPNPWPAGIGCVLIGIVMTRFVIDVVTP
jgi:hypothetical protein